MTVLLNVTSSGLYDCVKLHGENRNTDTGVIVNVPEGERVHFNHLEISNVFIPLIKLGKGKLSYNRLITYQFGGDNMNLRSGNIYGIETQVRENTPTRPYMTCVRQGNESVEDCLYRYGQTVYDASLLEFITHSGGEVIPGYHVDGVLQAYATKADGYTLDPKGAISDIVMPYIDAEIEGSMVQGIIGSEANRYTNIHLGSHQYKVLLGGYKYHAVFNQLDNSSIGGDSISVRAGTKVRISARKPTQFSTYNNHIHGLETVYT